jgi:hypothetical protein
MPQRFGDSCRLFLIGATRGFAAIHWHTDIIFMSSKHGTRHNVSVFDNPALFLYSVR